MRRRDGRTLVAGLLFVDAAALAGAILAALAVHSLATAEPTDAALLVAWLPLTMAAMAAIGLYRTDELFCGHREYGRVARACTYAAFAGLLLTFFLEHELSRWAFVLLWCASCLAVGGSRFCTRRIVAWFRRRGRFIRRAIIAGTDEHAVAIGRQLSRPGSGWQILGFLDDFRPVGSEIADGLAVVGDPKAGVAIAGELDATDIILVPHAVSWEAQRDLVEVATTSDRTALSLAPGLYHLLAAGTRPLETAGMPLMSIERLRITGIDAGLKTALDYGLSVAALPALGVALSLAWLSSRLTDGGPVLERRRAMGRGRRPFELLVMASSEATGAGVAWQLRRSLASGKLGKLPSVLNVLSGTMSLVGPRALPASTIGVGPDWATTLTLVRPGITGPHAINGGGWSAEEQALLDVAYVRSYSFWLDLRLLLASLMRALRREVPLPASYPATPEPSYAD